MLTIVENPDTFEIGEPRPADGAIVMMQRLLFDAENLGAMFPRTDCSVYYGEIDLTWRVENRLLRLVAFSDERPPVLYFQTESEAALTRGASIQATPEELVRKLTWLRG